MAINVLTTVDKSMTETALGSYYSIPSFAEVPR
jgi:hypothetical protein